MNDQHPTIVVEPIGEMAPSDATWKVRDGVVRAHARPSTDHFVSPDRVGGSGGPASLNSSTLLHTPEERDYVFSARVSAQFGSAFDAATLFLEVDVDRWAKLCFEANENVAPTIVSVVNRTVSDDATAFATIATHVWLRIARMGTAFAFHASKDGQRWEFLRFFNLAAAGEQVRVGFSAQSPIGEGCEVTFDEISFEYRTLEQLR